MTTLEIIIAVVNILAIAIIPLVAVYAGQKLQDRSQKRRDKLDIFKVLMMNRGFCWSSDSVRALNVIDVVFSDNDAVRARWKGYYNQLCIQNPNDMQKKQIQEAADKLLESMAHSLGYEKQVTWETIQNPYFPKGMMDAMLQQQNIQNGQEKLAGVVDSFSKSIQTTVDSIEQVKDTCSSTTP